MLRFIHTQLGLYFKKQDAKKTPLQSLNKYEDLTPNSTLSQEQLDSEVDCVALDALEWATNSNKNIRNIALTGPYGSGKSTVLHQFEQRNPQHKYLRISLATFRIIPIKENENTSSKPTSTQTGTIVYESENEKSDLNDHKQHITEGKNWLDYLTQIEFSILQQLAYRERWRKAKKSNFPKIFHDSIKSKIFKSLFVFCFIAATMVVLFPDYIQDTFEIRSNKLFDNIKLIAFVTFMSLLILIIYYSIDIYSKFRLSKINFKDGELELSESNTKSILNDNLSEIIYYFEISKCNIVFLEDLDRFSHSDMIFEKLREINTLLNQTKQLKSRRIIFIYATRDDLFSEKARTKFFDFIVPVIPVIDSRNSREKLLERLKDKSISNSLIKAIYFYIDDMRLLKNISNEFIMFLNRLNPKSNIQGFSHNQLLALVVFKNIYPNEFSNLYSCPKKNLIYNQFRTHKINFIKKLSNEIEDQISTLQESIDKISQEWIENEEDLRRITLTKVFEVFPSGTNNLKINEEHIDLQDISRLIGNKIFEAINNLEFELYSDLGNLLHIDKDKIRIILRDAGNRFQNLKLNANGDLNKINREIDQLKQKQRSLEAKTLKELIDDSSISFEIDKNGIDNELLSALIKNGFIDENYERYISIFYEGTLLIKDREFIDSVIQRNPLPVNFEISNVEAVMEELGNDSSLVLNDSILNFSIIEYLLLNDKYNNLDQILLQFNSFTTRKKDLFDLYLKEGISIELFIKKIGHKWEDMWNSVLNSKSYSPQMTDSIFYLIIKHCNVEDITRMKSELASYANKHQDFVGLVKEIDSKQLQSKMKVLQLKLQNLNFKNIRSNHHIIMNKQYEINARNISLLLKLNDPKKSRQPAASYKNIILSNYPPLISYIEEEIDNYVMNIVINLNTIDLDSTLKLLNHKKLSSSSKEAIISNKKIIIKDAAEIDDLWVLKQLIINDKLKPTWKNVLQYFKISGNKLTDELITYLNRENNYIELSKSNITPIGAKKVGTEEEVKAISYALFFNDSLSDSAYEHIIKSSWYVYRSSKLENVNESKVKTMINNRFLTLTQNNFNSVKKGFGLGLMLIESQQKSLNAAFSDLELDDNDLSQILGSENITDKIKLTIIPKLTYENYISNPEIGKNVARVIIRSNDIISLEPDIVEKIITDSSPGNNLKFFNLYAEVIDRTKIGTLLKTMGEISIIADDYIWGKEILNNDENLKLVTFLKEIGYINGKSNVKNSNSKKIKIYK